MYVVIDEKNKSVYKTASDRDEAFKALNELTMKRVAGHVHDVGDNPPESALETIDGPVYEVKPVATV